MEGTPMSSWEPIDVFAEQPYQVVVEHGVSELLPQFLADIERVALVRSGRDVVTLARIEGLEVRGRAVAVQSGDLGEVVLVVNPDSRKRLRGRVVGPALVEVLHVS